MEQLKKIHPKLAQAILELLVTNKPNYKFYGHFFLHMNINENVNMPTAGVYAKGTKLCMDYSPSFVDKLTNEETKWLLGHELKHLLYSHINRTKRMGYDHRKSNIVQDMIINSVLKEEFDNSVMTPIKGEYGEGEDKVTIPELLVPPEYDGERMYEPLYRWVEELEEKMKQEGGNSDDGDSDDGDSQNGDSQDKNSNDSDELKTLKDMLNNSEKGEAFDVHADGDLSDIEREAINGVINGIKARGVESGHFEGVLDKLKVTRKDNLKYIKQQLNSVIGTNPHKSFMREHRYGISGAKGDVYKSCEINAILDVSGSMSGGLIEKVLSNINQNNITINLILADTKVNKVYKVSSKKELQKVKILGYGGTQLQPAIDYIREDKSLNKNNLVVLTDGYCDSLDFNGLKGRNLIITTNELVKYKGGKTKQIKMDVGDL